MFPEFYQKVLQAHLNQSQYLLLKIMILLLQSQRQVQLSLLARWFPQPIQYSSRLRCLQRFLVLPQLSLPLLWHPIIKYWLRQEFKACHNSKNRQSRRAQLKSSLSDHVVVIIDRTQWRQKNLFVASILWGHHSLPLHWCLLPKRGSSNLQEQKKLLVPVLKLLKSLPLLIIGDREFHSAQLGLWLHTHGVDFILRQKANNYIQILEDDYLPLHQQGFERGDKLFFHHVHSHKEKQLGAFNLAVYWKRTYRSPQCSDPWYLLTTLSDCDLTLALYRQRWAIETTFKDCKTGGYNLESSRVNTQRFLAFVLLVVIAYSLATLTGCALEKSSLKHYLVRSAPEKRRPHSRYSFFTLGLARYGYPHLHSLLSDLAVQLMATKPHKWLCFQRGLTALSQLQTVFQPACHPLSKLSLKYFPSRTYAKVIEIRGRLSCAMRYWESIPCLI